MTELEALRRVAEAARKWARWMDHRMADENFDFYSEVSSALEALDALPAPAEPAGDVVEVRAAVFRDPIGNIALTDTTDPRQAAVSVRAYENNGWQRLATIRARVPLPRVPEVVGEVEG